MFTGCVFVCVRVHSNTHSPDFLLLSNTSANAAQNHLHSTQKRHGTTVTLADAVAAVLPNRSLLSEQETLLDHKLVTYSEHVGGKQAA